MADKSIPSFPEFRTITINDKQIFDSFLKPVSSEYTFTNFFCWRNCDHSKITKINDNLCILAEDGEETTYFFEPLGRNKIKETVEICADYLKKKGYKAKFSRLNENFIKEFKDDRHYLIEPDKNNFDYLYLTKDLIELKGKCFDGKRNRIKKFLKVYESKCENLTLEKTLPCLNLLERWKAEKKGLCIDEPIKEVLKHFDVLDLKGLVVLVDNKVEAFTVGENLNNETAVVYIEVANPNLVGLSQFINQKFSEEWAKFEDVNREQDLGDVGLRRAKLSYYPHKLIKKYNMTVKV